MDFFVLAFLLMTFIGLFVVSYFPLVCNEGSNA